MLKVGAKYAKIGKVEGEGDFFECRKWLAIVIKAYKAVRKIIPKSSQSHPGCRSDSSARLMRPVRFASFKCPIRGHLTTSWTKLYPILTPTPSGGQKWTFHIQSTLCYMNHLGFSKASPPL